MEEQKKPKVSIGVPVFNGEKFVRRRLESILSQTFTDFEIIISDNASTDMTNKICKEYLNKDKRIRYVRQNRNIGYINNFNFLIREAKGEYYGVASVDDLWEPTFLEKNVKVLDTQKNVVGSIGKVDFFGYEKQPEINSYVAALKKVIRRQNSEPLYNHVLTVSGDYEDKANKYLRFNQGSFVHGLFRRDKLQKRLIQHVASWDLVVILNILKEGDLYVVDEVLWKKFVGGLSSKGIIESYKRKELGIFDLIIPSSSLALWCFKNIGIKFFLKNIDWFIMLMLYGWRSILLEIVPSGKN